MIFLIGSQVFGIQNKTDKLDSIFVTQDLSVNHNWEKQALKFWEEFAQNSSCN